MFNAGAQFNYAPAFEGNYPKNFFTALTTAFA
jgi:hypothetical protein